MVEVSVRSLLNNISYPIPAASAATPGMVLDLSGAERHVDCPSFSFVAGITM